MFSGRLRTEKPQGLPCGKSQQVEGRMVIVEASQIPAKESIVDVPLDSPIEVYRVCQQLEEICNRENGIGISAVQVGLPWKLFLVRGDGTCSLIPEGKYGYFVNCEYEPITEEKLVSLEGCLSLRSPDGRLRSFQVNRYTKIRLFGYRLCLDNSLKFDIVDAPVDYTEEGIVFQHEIDHHRGILISDIGKELFFW
jgi:peptide deformylase